MEWQLNSENSSNLRNQEVAQEVLQLYMESLHDYSKLKNILSECSLLDYFGKCFYGQEEVCTHLIANLYGSSFELSSVTANDATPAFNWESFCDIKDCEKEEELGVSLISTPTSSFPGIAFSTPVRSESMKSLKSSVGPGKRTSLHSPLDDSLGFKKYKLDSKKNKRIYVEGPELGIRNINISPRAFHNLIPSDMKYLSSFGTIRYSKRVLSTSDPKRIKHHSVGTPRDRFCHLYIGYQCDEHLIGITNCRIWMIKYEISSKVTPRNLLKSFNESD